MRFFFLFLWVVTVMPSGVFAQDNMIDAPDNAEIEIEQRQFTNAEVKLLQELESRRRELDRREQALELRERLVDVAEKRLTERSETLTDLKEKVEGFLKDLSEKEEAELMQLVKIYEAMKPAAAATVLDRMDDKIVFDLFKRMKNKTTAQILEKMTTGKARVISEMLAEKSDLPLISQ